MTDCAHDAIGTLIFDAEGVVVDTEGLWDAAQQEFLARHGRAYDRAALKPMLAGRSSLEGVRALQRALDLPGDVRDLAAERVAIARRHFEDVNFVAGFQRFFAEVSSRFDTALATAMDLELFALVDARLGLTQLFEGRVSTLADVEGRGKPAPDLFLHAAANIGASPNRCIVFEDAPNGVDAARRARMWCIAVTTTFDRAILAGADLVVDTFAEIDVARLRTFGASNGG
jgi:beta-phosphoglucomutase-like phosphatase (HAD superfamily)